MRRPPLGTLLAVLLVLAVVVYGNCDVGNENDIEDGGVIGTPRSAGWAAQIAALNEANDALGELADATREKALAVQRTAERALAIWEAVAGEGGDGGATGADPEGIQDALEKANLAETAAVTATARVMAVKTLVEWTWDLFPDSRTMDTSQDAYDIASAASRRIQAAAARAQSAAAKALAAAADAEAAIVNIADISLED